LVGIFADAQVCSALLRIAAELEREPSPKLVWFLAPTLALCNQQFEVLSSELPATQVKFLNGNDNVDRWTEQSLWDAVLKNVGVVVSTYAILLDALTHAFVSMDRLSLIVFDEGKNLSTY
jgi:ERCC4-related helicase